MAIEDERIKGLLSTWGLAAKSCDLCKSTAALLFCRHHSAFFCGACDAAVHTAASHHRVPICEVCEQAPASVTCKADAAALCSSCDRDIHSANPLARRHERISIVPFSHAPNSDAKSDFFQSPLAEDSWLIPNFQSKIGGSKFLYSSEIDSLLDSGSPDHYSPSVKHRESEQIFNHRSYAAGAGSDSVVPIQAKSSHLKSFCKETCFEIDFTQSKLSPYNFSAQSASSSEVGIVPDGNANSTSEVSNFSFSNSMSCNGNGNGGVIDGGTSTPAVPLSRIDREARVMRYRERRKNRRFEKTIRYASRKAYAESRPRIKGRFARRTAADDYGKADVEQMYGSAMDGGEVNRFVFDNDLYGVVPSF